MPLPHDDSRQSLHEQYHAPRYLGRSGKTPEQGEEFAPLLAEFLDTFYGAIAHNQAQPLIADEPEALADAQEHALLGAIAEHLARRWQLAIPEWSNDPSRFLERPDFTTPLEGFKTLLIAESPLAFRRPLIFTEAEPLRRARMPRIAARRTPAP